MRRQNQPFLSVVILLGVLIGCGPSSTSQTEINKSVISQFNEVLNSGNFDRMDELFTPDFVRHSQASGDIQIRSLEQYKQYQKMILEAFPDEKNIIHIILAEEDYVAVYATLTATQKGAYGPFPATGKKISSEYIGIIRLEDGKISEMWVEWDNLAMLTQLGHYPSPAKGEE